MNILYKIRDSRFWKRVNNNPFFPLRVIAAFSALILGAGFCAGPNVWHDAPSFYVINSLSWLWQCYGFLFVIAGIALLFKRTRPKGYFVGGVIYSFFALVTWFDACKGNFSSLIIASNLTPVAAFYWTGLKVSIYDEIDPDRKLGGL